MQTDYNIFEYAEAKRIIAKAQIVSRYSDPCVCVTTYRTEDGKVWQEVESLLDAPENNYALKLLEHHP